MRELFGCFRLQASQVAAQAVTPDNTAQDTIGTELGNKNPTDTRNTSDESEPRAAPKQDADGDGDLVQENAQAGVQKMEATTQVWTKKHLVAAYVM
jgi:hypothetical protein